MTTICDYDYSGCPTVEAQRWALNMLFTEVEEAKELFKKLTDNTQNSILENFTFRDENKEVIELN